MAIKRMSFGSPAAKLDSIIAQAQHRHVMQAIDEATKEALANLGLEAFRFDIDVCPDEQWLRVKITMRPVRR